MTQQHPEYEDYERITRVVKRSFEFIDRTFEFAGRIGSGVVNIARKIDGIGADSPDEQLYVGSHMKDGLQHPYLVDGSVLVQSSLSVEERNR